MKVINWQVATGENFSLALSQSGQVYSWGINCDGQLGHGHKSDIKIPKEIEVNWKVADIACGDAHSVVLTGIRLFLLIGRQRGRLRFWQREAGSNGQRRAR